MDTEDFKKEYFGLVSKFGPELEKGSYIGSDRAHDCDRNSYRHRKDFEVYLGALLFFDPVYKSWRKVGHVFNVSDGKVTEFTDLSTNGKDGQDRFEYSFYFGKPYAGLLKDIWH